MAAAVVGSPAIAYAFSIGVAQMCEVELLVAGVDTTTAFKIFNRLLRLFGADVLAQQPRGAVIENFSEGWPIALRVLPPEAAARTAAATYHEHPVRVVQVVLSDQQKRFPWHPGVDPAFSFEQCAFADWRAQGRLH